MRCDAVKDLLVDGQVVLEVLGKHAERGERLERQYLVPGALRDPVWRRIVDALRLERAAS